LGRERTEEGRGGKGLGMRREERKEGETWEREERKGKKGGKGRSNPSRTKILATALVQTNKSSAAAKRSRL